MQIFGDPSRIPVVVIEQHVMNVPQHSSSVNNSPSSSDQSGVSTIVLPQPKEETNILTKTRNTKRTSRVLRAVVFVHGFQVNAQKEKRKEEERKIKTITEK